MYNKRKNSEIQMFQIQGDAYFRRDLKMARAQLKFGYLKVILSLYKSATLSENHFGLVENFV